jgi:hypothetical protein
MPIDDALGDIEGVPEYVLKKPISKVIETLEELQEKYKHKFNIELDNYGDCIFITSFKNDYKDLKNNNTYRLYLALETLDSSEEVKLISLINNNGRDWQSVGKDESRFYEYTLDDKPGYLLTPRNKKDLENWFYNMEKHILEEIPELKDFVKICQ